MSWWRRRKNSNSTLLQHDVVGNDVSASSERTPESQSQSDTSPGQETILPSSFQDEIAKKGSRTAPLPSSNTSATLEEATSYPHWHDVVAGAAAGLGARAITAPLDLLKIRRQLQLSSPNATATSSAVPQHSVGNRVITNAVKTATDANFVGEWNILKNLYDICKREGGVKSLFRGNVAASYLWMGYSVVQFSVYGYSTEYLTWYFSSKTDAKNELEKEQISDKVDVRSGVISFASGAIAGICGTLVTYPCDLCRTIFAARGLFPIAASNVTWSHHTTHLVSKSQEDFQRRPPKTLQEFAHQLYIQKGVRGFFAGSAPAMLQIVPYMGLNFALHDLFVRWGESNVSGNAIISGIGGMGAGVISKFLVYPLDTVKKRLQAQAFWGPSKIEQTKNTIFTAISTQGAKKVVKAGNVGVVTTKRQSSPSLTSYEGMFDCFKQIAKREGAMAFYKGLIPSLLKSSVSTGASFWLFSLTKDTLQSFHDSRKNY